ncbi:outer membrane beta-barrel protein [Sediminibacterium roseum]|uniref:Outer membrane beta-barrel protein n=1 Tax=Sediminibacterium roseum TaxID=1978412 RepID=A0ABX0A2R6_9BACT|nr:outer membrane beta-barrel protein [Sediminibacterium roseum]NCI51500.1 outer membrane beta-barrel protein [Sediminibacterium roseum]
MKKSVVLILLLLCSFSLFAQKGKIAGKISNSRNEGLSGVTIKIGGAATGFVKSDVDGRYSFTAEPGKKYSITVSYIGYKDKTIDDISLASANEEETVNIVMEEGGAALEGVTVKASSSRTGARAETINALISYQKNTSAVAQVISGEAIRRSPDKNTGEVLKRVPGTSVQEGKYLVVRGLADRYNQAILNGVLLSSTEPDRKTFSFDVFPAPMIDNIIINKAFVPELPGEWAGGLIQVNTKDVPSSNFFTVQIGTGFNTQTAGSDFYHYQGGKSDWLGFDDGTRGLTAGFPTKSEFNALDQGQKTIYGRVFKNIWSTQKNDANFFPVTNKSFQVSGGFNTKLGEKNKLGVVLALTYNQSFKRTNFDNRLYSITGGVASLNFDYHNDKYAQDVLWGALGNVTLQLGNNNKISWKTILNVNATDYTTKRTGKDFENDPINGENIRASELALKSNTFFNTQVTGDHNLPSLKTKLHWYGSFNILDQYIPDQRRIQYNQNVTVPGSPYLLLVSASKTSQRSGSRYFGFLNDYIYTSGGDATKTFNMGGLTQSVKAGYMLQVKDRLFDSRPFSIYLPSDNPSLRLLSEENVFADANFGNGFDNKFAFNEISGEQYRYLANTILNAGFLQFDNQINAKLRATWGLRWENFDQVVGSMKEKDPRHVHSKVDDFLPGLNLTYKQNDKTNIRLSGSQTVIRPEFRELSPFAFFDFDLGATTTGNKALVRTKVTNADLRWEMYPRAGELFTIGVFYKYFDKPIELFFNQTGAGSSSTFNYINADKASGYGVEVDFRKKLDVVADGLRNFTFQGNFSYIYNRVTSEGTNLDRPMQGQSPYLINATLQYDVEKLGLNTTLLFNQIGRRILYVGSSDYPPVWENPRPLVDFQIAKKVLKRKGEVKLNVSDLLNQVAYYYHDLNNNGKFEKTTDAISIARKYGTNVSISFSYNIK